MADAGFEAVLGTVLLLGVAFGQIDEQDYADPASDLVLAIFGLGLFALAAGLGQLVKREAISDTVLRALAAGNIAFAALIAIWVLTADGFTTAGTTVVWVTVVGLLLLGTAQARLLIGEPGRPGAA